MSYQPKDLYNRIKRVTTSGKHIPAFDGMRCLAIMWVAMYHLNGSFSKKAPLTDAAVPDEGWFHLLMVNGRQGVPLFFVLSGFFLCLPFARRYLGGKEGIDLKAYYVRRFIRIVPPYWTAVVSLAVAYALLGRYSSDFLIPRVAASLGFAYTFVFDQINIINSSFWALEVEMQFYIVAPALVYLYFLATPPIRRTVAFVLIALIPLMQIQYEANISFTLLNFLQYFLAGFVISDLYVSGAGQSFRRYWFLPLIALPIILFTTYDASILERMIYPFMIVILYLAVLSNPFWEKVFSQKYAVAIGGISYSIYLIHFPIIGYFGTYTMPLTLTGNYNIDLIIQTAMLLPAILVLSAIFYLVAERPFMLIRPRGRTSTAVTPERNRT